MTAPVTMYSTRFCPYCIRAKMLLEARNIEFTDIPVDAEPARRREMQQRSGRHTVPQIWVGEVHVGGYDDLAQLERQGNLDQLIAQASGTS